MALVVCVGDALAGTEWYSNTTLTPIYSYCQTYNTSVAVCNQAISNMQNNDFNAGVDTYCSNVNCSYYKFLAPVLYAGASYYYLATCFCVNSGNRVDGHNLVATIANMSMNNVMPVALNGVSQNTTYRINNMGYYQCMGTQTNPCADVGWTTYATGVEYMASGRSCPTSGADSACTGGTTSYRCMSGYYGYSSSGVPTCTSCATTGFSNATSIAGDNSDITKCYLPVASYMDTVGTFDITGTYCNYSLDGYDHIVPPACSELVAQGCSLPSVGHECYAAYSRASSGDLVCIDCSALDKDGLKMINTCYKD